jgi:predicted outer membrane protein
MPNPRSSRFMIGAGLVLVTGVATAVALLYPVWSGYQNTSMLAVTTSTPYGPLTQSDIQFVQKVRMAGLWEGPVGEMALQKGTTPAVKTAGVHLILGHEKLDAMSRSDAAKLGIPIPNQPMVQQQGFVNTLRNDTGTQFDTDMANILRVTHGQIFSAIASTRATTENSLVRQLADAANDIVLDHITQMENTGDVDYPLVQGQITAPPTFPANQTAIPTPPAGQPTAVFSVPASELPTDVPTGTMPSDAVPVPSPSGQIGNPATAPAQ